MEPTTKQLTDMWFLCANCTEEATIAEIMRKIWNYVEQEIGKIDESL